MISITKNILFIMTLHKIKSLVKVKILILLVIFFIFSAYSSHNKKTLNLKKFNISSEEYVWLEKFFRNFMLEESAIYTLAGTKPLTVVHICYDDKEQRTDEDRRNLFYILLNHNNKNDMIFYKTLSREEKKKSILIPDKHFIYNIDELWDKWEKIQHRFPLSKKFLLVKHERSLKDVLTFDPKCKKIYDVSLVNIYQTALILQTHYDLFKQAVGYDFDPLSIVFDLENKHSDFWNRIKSPKYCVLWGLLFGFGKKNSYGYLWKWRHIKNEQQHDKEKEFSETITQYFSNKNRISWHSINDFLIPAFSSYSENDPVVAKYEEERKKIQRLYKGKDFVDFTLQLLTTD